MVMRRVPSLNALRAFDAVARHGSFTGAAKELCVTHGAVSRHISILEDSLGMKLFIRGSRAIELTPAARAYLASIQQAFDMLKSATSAIVERNDVTPLKIKGMQTFVLRWLIPRIQDLEGLSLDLSYVQSGNPVDFERDDADLSIEAFPSPMPGTTSYKLVECDVLPICSPHQVNGRPPPQQLSDLANYTLLCPGRSSQPNLEHNLWQFWLNGAGLHEAYRMNCSYFATFDLIIRAAVEGLGVGMGVRHFVEKELSAGTLVVPFDFATKFSIPYYLVVPDTKKDWPKVQTFRDWIIAKFDGETSRLAAPASD